MQIVFLLINLIRLGMAWRYAMVYVLPALYRQTRELIAAAFSKGPADRPAGDAAHRNASDR